MSIADRPVELTATEYEVLRVLSLRRGWVPTWDSLLRQA
ncbi:MAG: helix-turn-helix domain-containing protein [Bryobacterales bacterium]|nr:helix-turn-helix domain-containing protein [Bryobacterales bacterium]